MSVGKDYFSVLTAAINDIAENGYDSVGRVEGWIREIKEAAARSLKSEHQLENDLRQALETTYRRLVDQGQIAKYHVGVARFTIERLRPAIRQELDKRIAASAELIKLHRSQAIDRTLQRFSGWATSVPAGGSDVAKKAETKAAIKKPLSNLAFEDRRVAIDQGHKLVASINAVIAQDGGAIAAIWRSNAGQPGYDYREDHLERQGIPPDFKVYAIRGSWASEKGLLNSGDGYTDDMTQPAEEVFCRCYYQYLYSLRAVHKYKPSMLTKKGLVAFDAAKREAAVM
jgi:hypothetical protein